MIETIKAPIVLCILVVALSSLLLFLFKFIEGAHLNEMVDLTTDLTTLATKTGGSTAVPPRDILVSSTVGGVGNQRECIINAVLLARALDLCLFMPAVLPDAGGGHGLKFLPPYHDPTKFTMFDMVFDTSTFKQMLQSLQVCFVEREPQDPQASELAVPDHRRGTRNFTREPFRSAIKVRVQSVIPPGKGLTKYRPDALRSAFLQHRIPNPHENGTVLYVMSTCYHFALSRGESKVCQALGPDACHTVTQSLQLSAHIYGYVERLLNNVSNTFGAPGQPIVWYALHAKAWKCQLTARMIFDNLERMLKDMVKIGRITKEKSGLVFISEVSRTMLRKSTYQVQKYFKYFVTKEKLWPTIHADLPLQICAQLDFELANALTNASGGIYFGERESSSDMFLQSRRQHSGLKTKLIFDQNLLCKK